MEKNNEFDLTSFLDDLGQPSLTKKGNIRKRKPKEPRIYFPQAAEDAIILYLQTTDSAQRNIIYNEHISYAFYKLCENIIHTFKFYHTDTDSIEELKHEVQTFLLEKLHLYNPAKGHAFAYFGTIAKRYLILYNEKNYTKLQLKTTMDEVDEESPILSDNQVSDSEHTSMSRFLEAYIDYVDKNLKILFPKDYDAHIADSIMQLFRKRDSINIFNKKILYIYIREMVDVPTPHITKVSKKLNLIRKRLFNHWYENDCL